MTGQPKVSVLIPAYNYARFLDEAIESVLTQSFQDFELIIVDNKSTDNTLEVLNKYHGDPRIKIYTNEKNIGLVANFNKALEYATGEYIKYLMADDKLHPQTLEKYVNILDQNPDVSLVTAGSATFGENNEIRQPPLLGRQDGIKVIATCLKNGKGNWIGEPSVVMYRRDADQPEKFNSDYICLVDLDMWLRLLSKGNCYILPETLAYFRVHDEQASNRKRLRNWFDEYYFYRDVKKKNIYNVQLDEINIDDVVKRKAKKCVKRTFVMLPKFYKKGTLALLAEALKIGIAENVIW